MDPLELSIIPICTAFTEAIKKAFKIDSRFAVFIAIGVGIALALLAAQGDPFIKIFKGISYGFGGSGLYSGVKAQVTASTDTTSATQSSIPPPSIASQVPPPSTFGNFPDVPSPPRSHI